MDLAPELLAERLDQARSKTSPVRRLSRRTVPLGPLQMQALRPGINGPGDLDAAGGHRQGAELRGVGAKLVKRHRDGNPGSRRHPDIGPRNGEFRYVRIVESLG